MKLTLPTPSLFYKCLLSISLGSIHGEQPILRTMLQQAGYLTKSTGRHSKDQVLVMIFATYGKTGLMYETSSKSHSVTTRISSLMTDPFISTRVIQPTVYFLVTLWIGVFPELELYSLLILSSIALLFKVYSVTIPFQAFTAIHVPLLFNMLLKIQPIVFLKMCLVSNITSLSIKLLTIQSTIHFGMHLVI